MHKEFDYHLDCACYKIYLVHNNSLRDVSVESFSTRNSSEVLIAVYVKLFSFAIIMAGDDC